MKTLIHLSDLHFGKVDYRKINPLLKVIAQIKPDIVVISGDFTQRAKEEEFKEARKFIKKLSLPVFVIPGNHDIPLYNAFKRFSSPFKSYSKFISKDLSPFYADEEISLIGINSVRRLAISSGKINKKHIDDIEERIRHLDPKIVKIVVCHHPFDLPKKDPIKKNTHKVVAHSKLAVEKLSKHKVDVYLSGHLHLHHVADTTLRYKKANYSSLIVQAGTAISKRSRGEPVSFNVIKIKSKHIVIDCYAGNLKNPDFNLLKTEVFSKNDLGWKKK